MRLLALALLMAAALFCQGDTDPDDPNPEWPGQKLSCNNYHNTEPAHKCVCAKAQHQEDCSKPPTDPDLSGNDKMSARCRTYCRKDHCHCQNNCTS